MDNSLCTVLYLDRRARATGLVTKSALERNGELHLADAGDEDAAHNIHTLVAAFGEGRLPSETRPIRESVVTSD